MDEELIRTDITRMLAKLGIWYYHPPDYEVEKYGKARPDILCINAPLVIESKRIDPKTDVEAWFDPARISDAQRIWLDMWVYEAAYDGYIGIGTIETPRRIWVIHWRDWVEMEKRLGEKDLSFKITLSNLEQFKDEELTRIKGGWELKPFHTIRALAPTNGVHPFSYWNKTQYSFRFKKEKGGKVGDPKHHKR